MDNLTFTPFANIDLQSPFFNSLRDNYEGFDDWFYRKAQENARALVYYADNVLKDFLYLKEENEPLCLDDHKTLPAKKRLKVGTFKIERRGTNRGERFMKRILDIAVQYEFQEVYVTMFDDTEELLHLRHFFEKYGFAEVGRKSHNNGRSETVLLRDMQLHRGNIICDYPFINKNIGNKYILSIYPQYHTKLFPDSILKNEHYDLLKDVSPTNSINKIYICWMKDTTQLCPNDKVIIYRTSDKQGAAAYRSVTTSICTIKEIMTIRDFTDEDDFVQYANRYSIFQETDLRDWYKHKPNFIVINMLYNLAFQKKVIRKEIIEQVGISHEDYWGFLKLTETQFNKIIELGNADGRYFIH